MKVIKIEKALLAFAFFAVANDTGTNFNELETDVKTSGGTVERVSDDLVVIRLDGANYTLPLNFAVIINGGVGKIVSKEVFETEYTIDIVGDSFDFNGFIERIAKLEVAVDKLASASGADPKSINKKKGEKGADKAQDD